MIFSRPWSFLFLLAGPLLAALFISAFRSKARLLKTMGDPAVLKKLMDPLAPRRQKVKAVLLVLSAILFALALAGPRWGQRFQDLRRRGIDVVIAVDVSASMLAEDLPPNRLTQAKRELGLLINRLEGDRVGLVAFAGTAFLQCPLTLDYGAVRSLLELIDTDLIPTPGTNLAAAIHTACDAFRRNEKKHKALVLLTDGEDHSGRFEDALRRAAGEGVRVFAIGFGNPDGEVIPLRDAQGTVSAYRKDKTGQTVVSKLNETDLRSAAAKTGGLYFRASQGEIEVDRVAESLRQMEKKHLESRVFDQYEDRYRWPLALLLLILFLEFLWPETTGHFARLTRQCREKFRSAGLMAIFLFGAMGAEAGGRTQYNDGNALYRRKDFAAAYESYENAQNLFQDKALKARSAFNAGNALYRQGQPAQALEKYKQALRLTPRDMDAKHNLEFVQKILKSQESKSKGQNDATDKRPGQDPMSKEDAERLLQAVEGQEKEARKKMKSVRPQAPETEQDW